MNHQFFTLVWACFVVISPEANFAEKVSRTKAATAHFTDSIELVRSVIVTTPYLWLHLQRNQTWSFLRMRKGRPVHHHIDP